jgi:hypothetical protein
MRCPEENGLHRIVRPTIPEGGVRTVAGGVRKLAVAAGARRWTPTADGEVHTAAESIRSRWVETPANRGQGFFPFNANLRAVSALGGWRQRRAV